MIHNIALAKIQRSNFLHFFWSQFKIPDLEVFDDSFFMNGFWNDDNAALDIPA